MSHPLVQVGRRTKAALIAHVLRAYKSVTANEPVCAARKYDYLYDHNLIPTRRSHILQHALACLSAIRASFSIHVLRRLTCRSDMSIHCALTPATASIFQPS